MNKVRLAVIAAAAAGLFVSVQAPSAPVKAAGYACPATADSTTPTVISGTSYCFNTFTTVGTHTWTHPAPGTSRSVQLLIVGGGGAGGSGYGAGGGGGGAVYIEERSGGTSFSSNLTVRVGAGGTVGATTTSDGGDGSSSSVTTGGTALTCATATTNCASGGKGGKGSPLSTGANTPTSPYGTGPNLGSGGATIGVNGWLSDGYQANSPCCSAIQGGGALYKTDGTYGWYSGGGGAGSGSILTRFPMASWTPCCVGSSANSQSGLQGYPPNSKWGKAGYPTQGYLSSITGTSRAYGSGGGGGNDMVPGTSCDSWHPDTGSGCGTNTRDGSWNQSFPAPRVAAAGTDGRGGGGGGGGKNPQNAAPGFGAAGGSGAVIIRWAAPYLNDATVTWNPSTGLSTTDSPAVFAAATTNSSGAISYSVVSTTASSCTVNSGARTLTFSGEGNCVVRATSAATASYASASLDRTFTISRASQAVSWSPVLGLERTSSPEVFAAATTSGDGAISYSVVSTTASSCTVNSGARTLTFSGEGNCVVRASAAQTDTYSAATLDRTFVIADTTAPVLVLAAVSAASSSQNLSFTLTGNEAIDCNTVTSADFVLTAVDQVDSVTQTTPTRCTISATSSVAPGSSGTSSLRASSGFSVEDEYGNAATSISSGSPASVVVTIADVTAPVLTLAAVSANVSGSTVAFTLSGNEPIDCSTVTSSDFGLTNISRIDSVVQTSPSRCTVSATVSLAAGSSGTVTLRASLSFAVEDSAGNIATSITTGSVTSVLVTVPAATTTTSVAAAAAAEPVGPGAVVPVVTTLPPDGGLPTAGQATTTVPARSSGSGPAPVPVVPTTSTTTTTIPARAGSSAAPKAAPVPVKIIESLRSRKGTVVIVNGRVVESSTELAGGVISVTVAGVRSSLSATSDGTGGGQINADGVLVVRPGEPVTASAEGLSPGSTTEVWLYSTPVRLGDAVTDARGAFVVVADLPRDTATGDHRLVVSGDTPGGDEVAIAFAVEVLGRSTLARVASSPLVWILLVLMVIVALVLPNSLRRRHTG